MYDELIKRLRECTAEMNGEKTLWHQAADAIEELQKDLERSKDFEAFWQHEAEEALEKFQVAISNKPRWIPVTERLPEDRQRVLAIEPLLTKPKTTYYRIVYFSDNLESVDSLEFDGKNRCGFYYYDSDYGFCEADGITHWMPLPQPPEREEA